MSSSIVNANMNARRAMLLKPAPVAARPPRPANVQSQSAQTQAEQRVQIEEDDDNGFRIVWFWQPSWLVSMLFHVILLLALALMSLSLPTKQERTNIVASTAPTDELVEEFDEQSLVLEPEPTDTSESLENAREADLVPSLDALSAQQIDLPEATFGESAPLEPSLEPLFLPPAQLGERLDEPTEVGPPVEFFGSKVQGHVAVVFDVTASMYGSIPLVLKEIDKKFRNAEVVVVHGATFKRYGIARLVPYRQNPQVYQYMLKNTSRNPANLPQLAIVHRELLALRRCQSLPAEGLLQSLGTAVEALLNQSIRRPKTIFVFSDFQDGIDPDYMLEVQQLAVRRHVKIVVYHPRKFRKDRLAYSAFAKATGGQLRETLPK